MLRIVSLLALCAVVLSGCGSVQAPRRTVPFNEADLKPFAATGPGSAIGQVFAKTRAGDVKIGAGCTVYLMPEVPYTKEFYDRALVNREVIEANDHRLDPYLRQCTADAEGRFEFLDLPTGRYLAFSAVTWEYAYDTETQTFGTITLPTGSRVFAMVSVTDGRPARVILTPTDRSSASMPRIFNPNTRHISPLR